MTPEHGREILIAKKARYAIRADVFMFVRAEAHPPPHRPNACYFLSHSWNLARLMRISNVKPPVDHAYFLQQVLVRLQRSLGVPVLKGVYLADDYRLAEDVFPDQFSVIAGEEDLPTAGGPAAQSAVEQINATLQGEAQERLRRRREFFAFFQRQCVSTSDDSQVEADDWDALAKELESAQALHDEISTKAAVDSDNAADASDTATEGVVVLPTGTVASGTVTVSRSVVRGRSNALASIIELQRLQNVEGTPTVTLAQTHLLPIHIVVGSYYLPSARAAAEQLVTTQAARQRAANVLSVTMSKLLELVNSWLLAMYLPRLVATLAKALHKAVAVQLDRRAALSSIGNGFRALQWSFRRGMTRPASLTAASAAAAPGGPHEMLNEDGGEAAAGPGLPPQPQGEQGPEAAMDLAMSPGGEAAGAGPAPPLPQEEQGLDLSLVMGVVGADTQAPAAAAAPAIFALHGM